MFDIYKYNYVSFILVIHGCLCFLRSRGSSSIPNAAEADIFLSCLGGSLDMIDSSISSNCTV